jgi:hypothetical protein
VNSNYGKCASAVRRELRTRGVTSVFEIRKRNPDISETAVASAMFDEVRHGRAVKIFKGVYATAVVAEKISKVIDEYRNKWAK